MFETDCLLLSQIRNEIQSFLFPRERDGVTVSAWEHSRFVDVIEARYLTSPEDIQHVHSVLADYFLGAWADRPKPVEATDSMPKGLDGIEDDRRVPRQPLTFRESGDGQEVQKLVAHDGFVSLFVHVLYLHAFVTTRS